MLPSIMSLDQPRWWAVGWNSERSQITFRVHRGFTRRGKTEIPPDAPGVLSLMRDCDLTSFSGTLFGESFGFDGGRLIRDQGDADPDYAHFLLPLPLLRRVSGACQYCSDDASMREGCISCGGTGEERSIDWREVYALGGTVSLFADMLAYPDAPAPPWAMQLIELVISGSREQSGISGTFGAFVASWLIGQPLHARLSFIEQAMHAARRCLLGEDVLIDAHPDWHFYASVNDDFQSGWLNVSIPGNACGINPKGTHFQPGFPYEFYDHNVDNAMQVLILLAGIGALCDRVDQDVGR